MVSGARAELDHIAVMDRWLESLGDLPRAEFLAAFERAFAAVWSRAHTTLGDVTLTAVFDRVVYDAGERFPDKRRCLLKVDGLDTRELCQRLNGQGFGTEELVRFSSFVLTELLTVIGALTAEVLTPALHRALLASHEHTARSADASGEQLSGTDAADEGESGG